MFTVSFVTTIMCIPFLQCECIHPAYQMKSTVQKCGVPNYKGDGNCDDENNHKECEYDGGDCCPKTVADAEVKTKYCTKVGCCEWCAPLG